jgi:L-rhamnose isomerase
MPWDSLRLMQEQGDFTKQLVLQEEYKNYPFGEVWAEFCRRAKTESGEKWLDAVNKYERDVLLKR